MFLLTFYRTRHDSGSLLTPPSPPMQLSPFNEFSDNKNERSGANSPYLHIQVSALSKSHSPLSHSSSHNRLEGNEENNEKSAYFQSYSSLLTNQAASNLHIDHTSNLHKHSLLPQSEKYFDQLDLSSETGSESSVKNSVTSYELAISLLDKAIANSASPDKNTPRKSSKVSSKKSSSSGSTTREQLARTVAEAIIAKLVEAWLILFGNLTVLLSLFCLFLLKLNKTYL